MKAGLRTRLAMTDGDKMTDHNEAAGHGQAQAGETTTDVDVLIAGGGPCGVMLAIELGRRGIRCLLV